MTEVESLKEAILVEANFSYIDFRQINFRKFNLSTTNLRECDFRFADLRDANLNTAQLTGIKIYNTALDGWNIENVKCDYIYLGEAGNDRHPKDRNFLPGEFEKLYKMQPTIEIEFPHGMSPIDPLILTYIENARTVQKDKTHTIDNILRSNH